MGVKPYLNKRSTSKYFIYFLIVVLQSIPDARFTLESTNFDRPFNDSVQRDSLRRTEDIDLMNMIFA
jgi:hypothetical protein